MFSMTESLKKGRRQMGWFSLRTFIIFFLWSSKDMALQQKESERERERERERDRERERE